MRYISQWPIHVVDFKFLLVDIVVVFLLCIYFSLTQTYLGDGLNLTTGSLGKTYIIS